MASADSILNPRFKEEHWVLKMGGILNYKHNNDINNPSCISKVPESIKAVKPEAYTPQVIALGPYHHFRRKLYQMQWCKLDEALKVHGKLKLPTCEELFNVLVKQVKHIRECYQEYLDMNDDTLTCMMVIDCLFLLQLMWYKGCLRVLQFIELSSSGGGQEIQVAVSESPPQFGDSLGRTYYSLDAILKDIVLLENQIPNIALKALLMTRFENDLTDYLSDMLVSFCAELSPIELQGDFPSERLVEPCHLLDVVHQLVWLGTYKEEVKLLAFYGVPMDIDHTSDIWSKFWALLKTLDVGFIGVFCKIVDLILSILDVLGISVPTEDVEEKALIPTASQLSSAGVKFCRVSIRGRGVRDIRFENPDKKPAENKIKEIRDVILSLPALKINSTSEVVMRNLLAYEAVSTSESKNFTRYIELMCGLVRSVSDVELLKNADKSILIVPQNADNAEVVKLFGSMHESIGNSSDGKSEVLDDTISKVNDYYNNTLKVKTYKLVKKYFFISRKVLTTIVLILLLLLMAMQTFCSIYSCHHIFKTSERNLSWPADFTSSF